MGYGIRRGQRAFEEHEKLKEEIQREKAEALGKAGELLEAVLRRLADLLDSGPWCPLAKSDKEREEDAQPCPGCSGDCKTNQHASPN